MKFFKKVFGLKNSLDLVPVQTAKTRLNLSFSLDLVPVLNTKDRKIE